LSRRIGKIIEKQLFLPKVLDKTKNKVYYCISEVVHNSRR
jgi:hypothetical protein